MRAPLAVALLVTLVASCRPVGSAGEPCVKSPCAIGLLCVDGTCEPPPEPECENAEDCRVDGRFVGAICEAGSCVTPPCDDDDACGAFICDEGECIEPEACEEDPDCGPGRLCDEGVCRDGCADDDECGGFSTCVAARCLQQCFGLDLICLGGLCEDGLCRDPECAVDDECPEGNFFCDGGRCETFTPCDSDEACFVPYFRCNELGRGDERALCNRDPECPPAALCIDDHCRDAVTCESDDECDDNRECIASRCVVRPSCRADDDCATNERCVNLNCQAREPVPASRTLLETPWGPCDACTLTMVLDETLQVRALAVDDEGRPVDADLTASVDLGEVVMEDDTATFTANAPGRATLNIDGALLTVNVIADDGAPLKVLVSEANGSPVEGATVFNASTDVNGYVSFATLPEGSVVRATQGSRRASVVGFAPTGLIRLILPADIEERATSGASLSILSTGDELGPVGLGMALSANPARPELLFGETFNGALELPVIGAIPVALPAGVSLSASLPVVGDQDVKPLAFVRAPPGPSMVTAFEGRFEQGELLTFLGGGADPIGFALALAAEVEGMDLTVVSLGDLDDLPLVVDEDDLDGDGDLAELRPDFDALPSVEVRPDQRPNERVGVFVPTPPQGARDDVIVVLSQRVPRVGDVAVGLGTGAGSLQVRARAPEDFALASRPRRLSAVAVFDDGRESRVRLDLERFDSDLVMGAFLQTPGVAVIAGDTLSLSPQPGADFVEFTARAGAIVEHVIARPSATTLAAPELDGASIESLRALRFVDDSAALSDHGPLSTRAEALSR